MSWYRKVVQDWNHIPACLDHFEKELAEARTEVKIKGNRKEFYRTTCIC